MIKTVAAQTGLLIAGGADDQLRVDFRKLQAEILTQNMVDRCILVRVLKNLA